MSSFTSALEFKRVSGGLVLTKPFTFYYNDDLTGEYITIPVGHFFNGATIPKVIQKLFGFDPFSRYWLAASIIHDALVGEFYDCLPVSPSNRILSWREATKWFNKAIKVTEDNYISCPYFYRKAFILAVTLYGIFSRRL